MGVMEKKRKTDNGNIVLIGFMGSGKTSAGIGLSYCLKKALEDTDKIIETREGKSISDIFASQGESWFRECESKLLEELSETARDRILSVGGGTPVKAENRLLLRRIGTVVYLRIRPETVYERLQGDNTRPLLQGEDSIHRIRTLLEQREKLYEETADIVVDVDGLDMEEVVDRILEGIRHREEMEEELSMNVEYSKKGGTNSENISY